MLKKDDFEDPGRLPSDEQLLIIRAALLPGPEGQQARSAWLENAKIERLGKASRRLLPLLYDRFKTDGVNHSLLPMLKGVKRHTWYRNQLLFRCASEAIGTLAERGIESMVIKGAAIATTYYHDASLRPMEDADLLVRYEDAPAAVALLRKKGWAPLDQRACIPAFFHKIYKYEHAMHLRHPSGQDLDLHWNLLPLCFGSEENEDFWAASRPALFNTRTVRTLDPADQLLHICVHGAAWDPLSPIRWIADAVVVIRATPNLNWERLLRQAKQRELTLTSVITLKPAIRYQFKTGQRDWPKT